MWSIAKVELYENPYYFNKDIREIPSVIGGDEKTRSGIVLAKSSKAKEFGIESEDNIIIIRIKLIIFSLFLSDFTY